MKDGIPPEIADMMFGEMPPEQQMYVISNNKESTELSVCFMRMGFMNLPKSLVQTFISCQVQSMRLSQ